MSANADRWLTPEQVSELLPFGNPAWVRQQLRRGRLRGSKVSGRWLAEEDAVTEMVEAGSNVERRRRKRAS